MHLVALFVEAVGRTHHRAHQMCHLRVQEVVPRVREKQILEKTDVQSVSLWQEPTPTQRVRIQQQEQPMSRLQLKHRFLECQVVHFINEKAGTTSDSNRWRPLVTGDKTECCLLRSRCELGATI